MFKKSYFLNSDYFGSTTFTECLSGSNCLNTNKPAKFNPNNQYHAKSISTGYCAHCRAVGLDKRGSNTVSLKETLNNDQVISFLEFPMAINSPKIEFFNKEEIEKEEINIAPEKIEELVIDNKEIKPKEKLIKEKKVKKEINSNVDIKEKIENTKVQNSELKLYSKVKLLESTEIRNEQAKEALLNYHNQAESLKNRLLKKALPNAEVIINKIENPIKQNKNINILNNFNLGIKDIFTSFSRVALGSLGLLLGAGTSVLNKIPIIGRLFKNSLFRNSWNFIKKPFYDGRGLAATGAIITFGSILATLTGIISGWVILPFLLSGPILLGFYLFNKSFKENNNLTVEQWINTKNLDSMQIKEKNDAFEEITAEYFNQLGYKAEVFGTQNAKLHGHKGPGDGGRDVIITDNQGLKAVVSCKRYADPVGIAEIYKLEGAKNRFKFEKGILVTTVGFTAQAAQAAKDLGISLITIDELYQAVDKKYKY
jgi:HJR/Mrr/RecB family endonuclease